jgi:DNA polymerase I-like protein with 3'-5' exonuclease and polymerase domains
MGNNVTVKKQYGAAMRALWQASPGRKLIGTDMDSAHLRLFAHMIGDPVFIQAMISGKEENDDDPHSLNALALGLEPRKQYVHAGGDPGRTLAKRFIYAFLNGAKKDKVASILGCSAKEAEYRLALFEEKYPGLAYLKNEIVPRDARRGFFVGLDGRKVMWDAEHGMIPGYLQNGEVIIMKRANILWQDRLIEDGIPFWQLSFVHDEWQTEVEDKEEVVARTMYQQCKALTDVGVMYGVTCPISGTSKSGYNWAETH